MKYYKVNVGLTATPTDIPDDALEVWIQHNEINEIEANTFSDLSQCWNPDLSSNNISEVESGAFVGLTALIHLSLAGNRLQQLYTDMFSSDLKFCNTLYVQDNQISEVQLGSFNGLLALRRLNFNGNQIREIPESSNGLNVVQVLERIPKATVQRRLQENNRNSGAL